MRGRRTLAIVLRRPNPHGRRDPSSVGLSPATFSHKGRRELDAGERKSWDGAWEPLGNDAIN
jgi:hypothetical protein